MSILATADVEAMLNLLATAADPTIEMQVAQRKRMILEGLGRMIGADLWLWATSRLNSEVPGDAAAIAVVDGGWIDEQERTDFFRLISHPDMLTATMTEFAAALRQGRSLTRTEDQLMEPARWNTNPFARAFRALGFERMLISSYPVGRGIISSVGFHRRIGNAPFSDRDRTVVHVIVQQVDWLHRTGSNVPASEKVIDL